MLSVTTPETCPPLVLLSSFQTKQDLPWYLRSKILLNVAGLAVSLLIVLAVYLLTGCFAFIFLPGGFFLQPLLTQSDARKALSEWRKAAESQLLARPNKVEAAFGNDPDLQETARFLNLLAKKNGGWTQTRFLPWDPTESVLTSQDGVQSTTLFFELQEMYDISFGDSEILAAFKNSWGELVNSVHRKIQFTER